MSRRSKYHSLGIMDALERWAFGGVPRFSRLDLFAEVSKNRKIDKRWFSKKVYNLKRGGVIEYVNDQEFILTSKGKKRINFFKLEKLSLSKKRDGFWRLIIFDIPEKRRGARELLRNKLLEFNCYQLQKSVYVTPYICEKELKELSTILGIGQYISVIVVKTLGDREEIIRRHFKTALSQ